MTEATTKTQTKRTPWIDGFIVARTPDAQELVQGVGRLVVRELNLNPRRPSSVALVERQVEIIVCNAALNEQTAIPLSKRWLGTKDRYRAPRLKESIRRVLDALVGLGYISLEIGSKAIFEPVELDDKEDGDGEVFVAENAGHTGVSRISSLKIPSIPQHHFSRHSDEGERIILKGPKIKGKKGVRLDYVDTPETDRMREELKTITDAIRERVEYIGDNSRINASAVFLQRFFTRIDGKRDFTQGGRIFGDPNPWWLNLSSKDRFNDIAICGDDRLVEVDYGQHAVRTLYALAGIQPDFEDAYTLPGYEDHREAVKTVLNSIIWANHPLSRFPQRKGKEPRMATRFPAGTRVQDVTEAIMKLHRPIAHLFHEDHGPTIQYLESQTIMRVLLTLLDAGVTALPYHDGILVAEEHKSSAVKVMLSVFKEVIGVEGRVKVTAPVANTLALDF